MTVPITELTYAEQPAVEWLRGLGWAHVHGPEIAPNGAEPERETWDEVVLVGRLRAALVDLNPEARSSSRSNACARRLRPIPCATISTATSCCSRACR